MENKKLDLKISYFLYARKSSESEDRQTQSIEDQVSRLNELALESGLIIIDTYRESKSARKPHNRPLFEEMIRRIENGEANGILCWQYNRLTRNPVDDGMLKWMLQQGVLKSIQTFERNYTPSDNVLLLSVEGGMANQYIIDLSKNVKRGMQSKLQKGWFPHRADVGYLNKNVNGENIIVMDPERFEITRKMWDLMLTGKYTPPKILEIANEQWNFKTRSTKRTGNAKLSRTKLYEIFSNPFYKGIYVHNGISYKLKHPPMVAEEEFDIVQSLLKRPKNKNVKHIFPYTGFIKCGECGCLYTAETKEKKIRSTGDNKKYTYYHCTRNKKDVFCAQKYSVREDILEKQIEDELSNYTILPEFRDWALEVLRGSHKKEAKERQMLQNIKQKELNNVIQKLDKLLDLKLEDNISDEEFKIKREELLKEKVRLKRRLEENITRQDNWMDLIEKAFNFVTNLREVFMKSTPQTKKEILMAIGKNISILDGKLYIEPEEWLVPIRQEYPALEKKYSDCKVAAQGQNRIDEDEIFEPIRTAWLGREDSNQC